jgi:Immunoglobulin domain
VTVNPHNLTINETEEILLFCGYEANPNSLTSVRWLRNNEVINLNQSRIDGGNTDQPALLVKNARRDDSGNYTCELTNQVGSGISDNTVLVDVQCEYTFMTSFYNLFIHHFQSIQLNQQLR